MSDKTANMLRSHLGITNFDNTIDDGLEKELIDNEDRLYSVHYARNFNGIVYYENNKFYEEVWIRKAVVEIISADTLQELVSKVCDTYGYE